MTSKGTRLSATVVSGHTFTVDTRYDLKDSKILGRGSYGVVTTAIDKLQHGKIAIKRIRPFANDEWDARHTLREIRLLKLLGPHPNVRCRLHAFLSVLSLLSVLPNFNTTPLSPERQLLIHISYVPLQIITLYDLSLFEDKTELYMMMEVNFSCFFICHQESYF